MKKIFRHRYFRGSISILLLVGIILTNLMTYFPWVIHPELEVVEFYLAMENDSEENEEKTEVEEDKKISTEFLLKNSYFFSSTQSGHNYSCFKFNFQPEIPTPPPEQS